MDVLVIRAKKEGYSPDQVYDTMTVGDLIYSLQDYSDDIPVYISSDGGYTYGGITDSDIRKKYIEDDEDDEDEEDEDEDDDDDEDDLEESNKKSHMHKFKESSREKEVTVDFPIAVSPKHKISFRDAKKLFKYLKDNKLLRKGVSYFVTDSEGNETNWDYDVSPYHKYCVEFSCEITGDYYDDKKDDYIDYDVYHSMLIGIDSRGHLDMSDIEWNVEKVN